MLRRPIATLAVLGITVMHRPCAGGPPLCTWAETAKLSSPAGGAGDGFGRAVAWAGQTLLIGCPGADDAGENVGAVFAYDSVITQNGVQWVLAQTLTPARPFADQRFGTTLATDPAQPDVLVIGSPNDGSVASQQGSAYIFHQQADGTWVEAQKLSATDISGAAWFGSALAIDGDTLLIGAPLESTAIGAFTGSAFVFTRDDRDLWAQQQKLLPQNLVTPSGAIFGASVALMGDRAIIGAPYIGNEFLPGAVEVFARIGGAWVREVRFQSPVFTGRDRFGSSVLLLPEDLAVIGAPRTPPPPSGLAYIFERSQPAGGGPQWTWQFIWTAEDATYNDGFGATLATAGDVLYVGAHQHDPAGAVYAYRRSGTLITLMDKLTASDGQPLDLFGNATAARGQTIAIGAWMHDRPAEDSGAAYLFELALPQPGDATGDCAVDADDLVTVILSWGECAECNPSVCPADLDDDCDVDVDDLVAVILNWG